MHASKNLILAVCVDDLLTFSKKKVWIDIFDQSSFDGKYNFELTDERSIDKHLGVEIDK